ncbi:MAG: secretin N-terminal domain-containing protein [Opitutales bacterium]
MTKSLFSILLCTGLTIMAAPAQTPPLSQLPSPTGAPAFAPPAGAVEPPAPPPPESGDTIGPINMPGDSLDAVLGLLERWTGKSLLRPQNLPEATLSLSLKEKVTKKEAIQAVETLLNLNGIAVTPLGQKFLKVTLLKDAKSEAPEFIEGSTLDLTPSGRTASKLFQLQFLRVAEFMPQIAGLLNPASASPPLVFDKANSALITDSLSNLQRIETLVSRLDQPTLAGLSPKFYTLKFAKASDVVTKMRTILSGALQNQLGTATTYNADDRTNQIVLITDSRQHAFFDDLIAKLDVKSDPNTRNEVIFLKHAAAKDVADILSKLVTGQNTAAKSTGQEGSRALVAAATTALGQPAAPATPAPVAAPALASLNLPLESSSQFSSILTILPEERSNSIVASGTVDDIRLIKDLVAKIDVLLAQVRIEVVIAEVTLDDSATDGISALGLTVAGNRLVGFSGSAAGITSVTGTIDPATRSLSGTIALNTTPRKSISNILSVPNIITTHNKEGKIFVGQQQPVITGYVNNGIATTTTTGTTTGGFNSTVSYMDIGITLTVKPLIGSDDSVQLEITQDVKDVLSNITIDGNPQPIIGSRTTSSFISAKSGEIIVLGGLQRRSDSRNTNRLGPIPIIGDLLGSRTRDNTRTDLIFFLRPTILTNTGADNATALRQLETLPKDQRVKIQQAIQPAGKKP